MTFAKVVKKHCAERGWNQAELMRRSGLGRSYIEKIFAEKFREPTLSKAMSIANAFDMPLQALVDEVFEDDDE